jgi:hypothetical protein
MSTNLIMTRGDTFSVTLNLKDGDGNDVVRVPGDIVYFTVKKSTSTADIVTQKTLQYNESQLTINPDDTKEIDPGNYLYDIQLTKSTGEVYTLVKPSAFTVRADVTW